MQDNEKPTVRSREDKFIDSYLYSVDLAFEKSSRSRRVMYRYFIYIRGFIARNMIQMTLFFLFLSGLIFFST